MSKLITFTKQFMADEDGVTMIEYALIAGLVSIIAIAAITGTGVSVNAIWTRIQTSLAAVAG